MLTKEKGRIPIANAGVLFGGITQGTQYGKYGS